MPQGRPIVSGPANGAGYPREPFKKGHEVNLRHGANTEKRVGPLAAQYAEALLQADATPQYLRDARYRPAIDAYCRALATLSLLWAWLDEQDIVSAATDVTSLDEEEDRVYSRDKAADGDDAGGSDGKGSRRRTTRRSTSRHITSALNEVYRWEGRAMALRGRLGLDPLSNARLGRDVAQSFDMARAIEELTRREGTGEP
jgi:hypothetical protein